MLVAIAMALSRNERAADRRRRRVHLIHEIESVRGVERRAAEALRQCGQIVDQRRREIGFIGRAEGEAVAARQIFVRVIAADHPVEFFGGARQPEFLAERVEFLRVQIDVAIPDVGGREVRIEARVRFPVAERGDRGDRAVPVRQGICAFEREAFVGDLLGVVAVGVSDAFERIGGRRKAGAAGEGVDDGARGARARLYGRAAILVALCVIADQLEFEPVVRREQRLAADGEEFLVLVFFQGAGPSAGPHIIEAVALAPGDIEARREGVFDQRTVQRQRAAILAEIAAGQLNAHGWFEGGRGGDHIDDAGRGVLAEQRALRPLQDLDALHVADIAEADAVAWAINAVNHDADGGFQAGIVADRADAANARGGGGFRSG